MAVNQVVKYNDESVAYVRKIITEKEIKNILLIRGKNSFIYSGADKIVEKILFDKDYTVFKNFENNPKINDVKKGVALLLENNCDCILAIGGGSVIDIAKLVSFYSHKNECNLQEENTAMLKHERIPIIAIPTTAGTGSECTHFAVLYEGYDKFSIADKLIKPDIVCLIPELTYSTSTYLSYVTAFDAFSQALESFWSINSTRESLEYSTKALKLIWNNINLVRDMENVQVRNDLLQASFYAGKAIDITKTTAPHAFSYYLSQKFNIPHGHAVAITLPFFVKYNYDLKEMDSNDSRGYSYIKYNLNELSNVLGINYSKLAQFITDFKFTPLFTKDVIKKILSNVHLFEEWPNHVNIERLQNNPRKIDAKVWPHLKEYLLKLNNI